MSPADALAPNTSPTTFDRLSDRINPIAIKELRQAVNSRFVTGMLFTLLGGMLTVLFVYVVNLDLNLDPGRSATRADGALLFGVLSFALWLIAGFALPVYVGLRLAVERASATGDLFRMTLLMPWQIVRGKMVAGLVLAGLIASACVPFLTVTWLLRGIDVVTILGTLATTAMSVAVGLAMALTVGASPHGPLLKVIYAIVLVIFTPILMGILSGVVGALTFGLGTSLMGGLFTLLVVSGLWTLAFLSGAARSLTPKGASRSRTTRGPQRAWIGRRPGPAAAESQGAPSSASGVSPS